MKSRALLMIPLALAAFGAGLWFAMGDRGITGSGPADGEGGYVLDAPRPLPVFELVDDRGQPFTEDDFAGHWSLLYFGFTYCPDICPSALGVMAQVKENLSAEPGLDDRYYLVSVDPDRDTPARLNEYVTYFDPAFRGLTGAFGELDRLTGAAGAVYKVPEAPADENYLVAHSSTLTLIDPQGRVHAIFTSPFDPVAIAERLARITRS